MKREDKEKVMANIMSEEDLINQELEGRKKVKTKKPPAPKKEKKPEPTESELVHKYAKRVIKNQQYHGRIDQDKFENLEYKTVSKNLWMDTDFYFSVVFQSQDQKMEFLEKMKWIPEDMEGETIQIVNGLELAKKYGIDLKLETTKPFPVGSIDLMGMVLDTETIERQ